MAIAPAPTIAQPEELIGRRIALLSSSVSVLLASAKVIIGLRAHSNSLVSDGLEGAGDVLSSAIVYIGLWLASKPPDAEHPYGHGRYETLAGLAVGGILLLTAAGILWHGFMSGAPEGAVQSFAVYPIVAAIVVKGSLAGLKLRIGRKIGSSAMLADAWHDITDLLSTVIALCAILLTLANPETFAYADRTGSIVIGVIVAFLSVHVVRRTVVSLLDTMPEASKMHEIRAVALSVPGAEGIEKCFARRTGLRYHVDLHLEVNPEMTVRQSHEIASRVKNAVKDHLNWVADVLVHVEPSEPR